MRKQTFAQTFSELSISHFSDAFDVPRKLYDMGVLLTVVLHAKHVTLQIYLRPAIDYGMHILATMSFPLPADTDMVWGFGLIATPVIILWFMNTFNST